MVPLLIRKSYRENDNGGGLYCTPLQGSFVLQYARFAAVLGTLHLR
jgi:hypothetical protein